MTDTEKKFLLKFIDAKVSAIYWWRSHKETICDIALRLSFLLWWPLLIVIIPLMIYDQGDAEEDEKWCKEHHYVYPDYLGWDCHRQVKKWKSAFKKAEKEKAKKAILQELKNENKS